jgi:hypothetical protein
VLLSRAALLALVLGLAGCPDDTLPECDRIDSSSMMLVASDYNDAMIDINDGSQVPLLAAPQGGHILLVGARVRAQSDCQLVATASLRDPATQRVLGLEQRPLLLDKRSDGWAVPRHGLDAMPNVAVCPTASATTAVFNHEYKLEVALTRLDGAPVASASAMVTPACTDSYCESDCGVY